MIHPTAKASREPIAAAFSSQYDKRGWGTEDSNPSLPTGESGANLTQNPSATRAASRERFRRYWSGIANSRKNFALPPRGGPRVRIRLPPALSQQRTLWLPGASHAGGTQSSNPLCSSSESTANPTSSGADDPECFGLRALCLRRQSPPRHELRLGRDQFEVEINDTQELSGGGRSRFRDYGGADRKHDGEIELRPGDEVRLKANSPHAHLTESHRLGRVEKVQGEKLLVRLKHASFRVFRS